MTLPIINPTEVTFELTRNNVGRFRVTFFNEDDVSCKVVYTSMVNTLEQAVQLVKGMRDYKTWPKDGFKSDSKRADFWRELNDRLLIESIYDSGNNLQHRTYPTNMTSAELSIIKTLLDK